MKLPMYRIVASAIACLLARAVSAADVGVESGVADDLTVYGQGGDRTDPDLEVKGYSAFGTNAAAAARVTSGPGNVFIGGSLEVARAIHAGTGGVVFADGTTQTTAAVVSHPLLSGECDTNRLDILVGTNYAVRAVKVWQSPAVGQTINVYSNGTVVSSFSLGGASASQGLTLNLAAFDRLGIACTNLAGTVLFTFEGSRL